MLIQNESQRRTLRQWEFDKENIMTRSGQADLRARRAHSETRSAPRRLALALFLSIEADVIRELRAFAATLRPSAR